MLTKLLRLAVGRNTTNTAELAAELRVSPTLVQQMLQQLTCQGYLQMLVPGCSTPCEGCPLQTTCTDRNQARIWSLTPKGAQHIARQ